MDLFSTQKLCLRQLVKEVERRKFAQHEKVNCVYEFQGKLESRKKVKQTFIWRDPL